MKLIKACWFSILLICASLSCAQELYDLDNLDNIDTSLPGTVEIDAQGKIETLAATATTTGSAIRQNSGNDSMLSRISKEYSSKQQTASFREKIKTIPGATSNFSLLYSQDGERPTLEYRFSENGALRLRGAHKGVKIVAAWKY
jgi:hypothetical protein